MTMFIYDPSGNAIEFKSFKKEDLTVVVEDNIFVIL